jgi:hypothetical protein
MDTTSNEEITIAQRISAATKLVTRVRTVAKLLSYHAEEHGDDNVNNAADMLDEYADELLAHLDILDYRVGFFAKPKPESEPAPVAAKVARRARKAVRRG